MESSRIIWITYVQVHPLWEKVTQEMSCFTLEKQLDEFEWTEEKGEVSFI